MSDMDNRIMARQVAQSREITFEELKLVAGGGNSTNGGMDCGPGWGTYEEWCLSSDNDPCDQIASSTD